MPPVGFEITISAGEGPQTYALDRAATGTGILYIIYTFFSRTQHRIMLIQIVPLDVAFS